MKVILNIDKATKRYGGLMANGDISFAVYEGVRFWVLLVPRKPGKRPCLTRSVVRNV